MAQPYVGEIRMFAGNFAPAGWMFCEGQLLPISENETLFQLIGTTYGGDGESTFALPDLRGRVPIHQGNGFILVETGGREEITLNVNQIAAHAPPVSRLERHGDRGVAGGRPAWLHQVSKKILPLGSVTEQEHGPPVNGLYGGFPAANNISTLPGGKL